MLLLAALISFSKISDVFTFAVTSMPSPDSHPHSGWPYHARMTASTAVCQPILTLVCLIAWCEPVVALANEARGSWSYMDEEKWHRKRFLMLDADRLVRGNIKDILGVGPQRG